VGSVRGGQALPEMVALVERLRGSRISKLARCLPCFRRESGSTLGWGKVVTPMRSWLELATGPADPGLAMLSVLPAQRRAPGSSPLEKKRNLPSFAPRPSGGTPGAWRGIQRDTTCKPSFCWAKPRLTPGLPGSHARTSQ